jgi:hypothetical protein
MRNYLKTRCSVKMSFSGRKRSQLAMTTVEAAGHPSIDRAELRPAE